MSLTLSRKRQKELRRLKREAEHLWDEQREAIEHASAVLKDARRQASGFAREEIRPRVRDGLGVARDAASTARERFTDDVLPAISGTIGSALAVLEATRDPRVRDVVRRATTTAERLPARFAKAAPIPVKKKSNVGRYVAFGIGAVAVAGVLYAAWQTLRADDDLWIEDLGEVGAADIGEDDEA
jgi:hypothetical protein